MRRLDDGEIERIEGAADMEISDVVEEAHDRITLWRDDLGDWYALVRRSGKGRGFLYEETAYRLDQEAAIAQWADETL